MTKTGTIVTCHPENFSFCCRNTAKTGVCWIVAMREIGQRIKKNILMKVSKEIYQDMYTLCWRRWQAKCLSTRRKISKNKDSPLENSCQSLLKTDYSLQFIQPRHQQPNCVCWNGFGIKATTSLISFKYRVWIFKSYEVLQTGDSYRPATNRGRKTAVKESIKAINFFRAGYETQ